MTLKKYYLCIEHTNSSDEPSFLSVEAESDVTAAHVALEMLNLEPYAYENTNVIYVSDEKMTYEQEDPVCAIFLVRNFIPDAGVANTDLDDEERAYWAEALEPEGPPPSKTKRIH